MVESRAEGFGLFRTIREIIKIDIFGVVIVETSLRLSYHGVCKELRKGASKWGCEVVNASEVR